MLKLEIRVDGDATERVRDLAESPLSRACHDLVRQIAQRSLQSIITENPVESGRSRAAWVQALEHLGGTAPPGWEGSHGNGVVDGRKHGTGTLVDGNSFSEATISNSVNYVRYLEYGTSRISPFAMVRRSLQRQRQAITELFRLTPES